MRAVNEEPFSFGRRARELGDRDVDRHRRERFPHGFEAVLPRFAADRDHRAARFEAEAGPQDRLCGAVDRQLRRRRLMLFGELFQFYGASVCRQFDADRRGREHRSQAQGKRGVAGFFEDLGGRAGRD